MPNLQMAPPTVSGGSTTGSKVEYDLCGRIMVPKSYRESTDEEGNPVAIVRQNDQDITVPLYTVDEATATRLGLPKSAIGAPMIDFCVGLGRFRHGHRADQAKPERTKSRETWDASQKRK